MKITTHFHTLVCLFLLSVASAQFEKVSNKEPVTFVIDLDAPPEDRWAEVVTEFREPLSKVVDWILEQFPEDILPELEAATDLLEHWWPTEEYRKELEGIAKVAQLPVGFVLLLNLTYELHSGCTSIVAQGTDGSIWHGRNLDYDVPHLAEITLNVKFVKGGELLYQGTTYAGYIGILTGMKPGGFSLSMDQRFAGGTIWDNIKEWIFNRGEATPFFFRDVFEGTDDYESALVLLEKTPLIAPSYMIIAGAERGQGTVVTRDRDAAIDTWQLSEEECFLVETNDDHWEPPHDSRRDAANAHMRAYGPDQVSAGTMLAVMNMNPTLNELTTYTSVMNPGKHYLYTMIQNDYQHKETEHQAASIRVRTSIA